MSARPTYLPSEKIRAALQQYADNGRWGTCVECPTQSLGKAGSIKLPALCQHTKRSDHNIAIEEIVRLVEIERRQTDGYIWKEAEVRVLIGRYDGVPVGSIGTVVEVQRDDRYVVVFRGSGGMGYVFPGMDLRLME